MPRSWQPVHERQPRMSLDRKPPIRSRVDHREPGDPSALLNETLGGTPPTDMLNHGVAHHHIESAVPKRKASSGSAEERGTTRNQTAGDFFTVGKSRHDETGSLQAKLHLIARVKATARRPTLTLNTHGEDRRPRRQHCENRPKLARTRSPRHSDGYCRQTATHSTSSPTSLLRRGFQPTRSSSVTAITPLMRSTQLSRKPSGIADGGVGAGRSGLATRPGSLRTDVTGRSGPGLLFGQTRRIGALSMARGGP